MNSVQSPSLLVPVTRDEGKRTMFGPWEIATSEIFAATSLSFAFVNLKPVVSGHVLVAPRRICKRFANLSMEETADLWQLAKVVGQEIEANAETLFPDRRGKGPISLTLCIQDGPQAGQTVPHVHIHVMPRQQGDFENNDDVYDEIDASEKTLKQQLDSDRKDRSAEVMASEAEKLRKLFYN